MKHFKYYWYLKIRKKLNYSKICLNLMLKYIFNERAVIFPKNYFIKTKHRKINFRKIMCIQTKYCFSNLSYEDISFLLCKHLNKIGKIDIIVGT